MAGRGNPFSRNFFVGDNYETRFSENFILKERVNPEVKVLEHLYPLPFKVIDDCKIYTRSYVKSLRGKKIHPRITKKTSSHKGTHLHIIFDFGGKFKRASEFILTGHCSTDRSVGTKFPNFWIPITDTYSLSTSISSPNHGWKCKCKCCPYES